MAAKISIDDFNGLLNQQLPWAAEMGFHAERIDKGFVAMRLPVNAGMVRPGGTLSGPAMMALADAAMYAVVLSEVGHVLLAVTTNFNINFLRRPPMVDIIAEGRAIKVGKRLAVLEVTLFSDGAHEPIAHATGTYSIPPDRENGAILEA